MRKLVYGLVFGGLVLLIGNWLLKPFYEFQFVNFTDLVAWPALRVGGLLFVAYAFIQPSIAKIRELLVVALVGAACVSCETSFRWAGIRLFWSLREAPATEFVADLLSYRRIWSMSDGTRYFKTLNDELLGSHGRYATVTIPRGTERNVFRRDGVDTRVFADFRRRLQELDLTEVTVSDDYVAFVDDGFLDNLYGFVWVRPGRTPPQLRTEFVEATELTYLRPLGHGWYYFETT